MHYCCDGFVGLDYESSDSSVWLVETVGFGYAEVSERKEYSQLHWHEMGAYDNAFDADVMFDIKPLPKGTWAKEECYSFDWSALQGQEEPFAQFDFSV